MKYKLSKETLSRLIAIAQATLNENPNNIQIKNHIHHLKQIYYKYYGCR